MYTRIRSRARSAAFSTASAWASVSDLDGRPVRPSGTSAEQYDIAPDLVSSLRLFHSAAQD